MTPPGTGNGQKAASTGEILQHVLERHAEQHAAGLEEERRALRRLEPGDDARRRWRQHARLPQRLGAQLEVQPPLVLERTADQRADPLREVAGELEMWRAGDVRHFRTFTHAHRHRGTDVEQNRKSGTRLGCAAHQGGEVLEGKHTTNRRPLGVGVGRRHLEDTRRLQGVTRGPGFEEERESPTSVVRVRGHEAPAPEAIASRRDPVMLGARTARESDGDHPAGGRREGRPYCVRRLPDRRGS